MVHQREVQRTLVIIALLLVSMPAAYADALSYSLSLQYDSGNFSLKGIDLVGAASPRETSDGEYVAKITSFRGETLYSTSFNVNSNRFYGLPISKGTVQAPASLTKIPVSLLLPYFPNAKSITILKTEAALLTINASQFSACNENSVCDVNEGSDTCPTDCACGNQKCDSNENYNTCSKDCPAKSNQGNMDNIVYYAAGLIIALVIIGFVGKKVISGKNNNSSNPNKKRH